MEARAVLRYARISPRKVSIVLDLIRNKPADVAMAILKHTPKAASEYLEKLLKSAVVSPGPILKRIRPSAHGRAFRINKRTSHVTLVLKEKE